MSLNDRVQSVTGFASELRVLETALAARCLQARARAHDLRMVDHRYKALIDLFIAGTRALVDAIADLGDSTASDFHSGFCAVTYLRSRHVIGGDVASIPTEGELRVSETFLLAERVQLGSLLDLCATFLDRLEDHYEIYDAAIAESGQAAVEAAA